MLTATTKLQTESALKTTNTFCLFISVIFVSTLGTLLVSIFRCGILHHMSRMLYVHLFNMVSGNPFMSNILFVYIGHLLVSTFRN